MTRFGFSEFGRVFVPINIKAQDENVMALLHFKVDTGADTTTISKNAGYVKMPLINILGYEGRCWPFQIIIDERLDFRNLLGRDLLTGFNYWFSNDEDKFTIARAKEFKPRYRFLPGQEINEITWDLQ